MGIIIISYIITTILFVIILVTKFENAIKIEDERIIKLEKTQKDLVVKK